MSVQPGTQTDAAPEFFLRLSRAQVRAKVNEGRFGAGASWQGLLGLMERQGYEHVFEIGHAAAAAWATHLGLTPRPKRR